MESFWAQISWALGLEEQQLTYWQMGLRAVLVYIYGIMLVQLGDKRFIGRFTAFDVIMGIMIGSILSRAITAAGDFIPMLAGALALVLMHRAFATLAYYSDWSSNLIKGKGRTLVIDGQIQWKAMRGGHISEQDLKGELRESARVEDVSKVKLARLERSGNISVILKDER